MIIEPRNPTAAKAERQGRPRPGSGLRPLSLVVVVSVALGLLVGYVAREIAPIGIKDTLVNFAVGRGFAAFERNSRLRHSLAQAPAYLQRYLDGNDFPTIAIDIDFVDMQKLEAKRREALAADRLVTAEGDMVPATVRSGTESIDVDLRLKGDYVDHLEGSSKWSFRIEVKGDEHIYGMRTFSVQHPRTRGFQGELLFHTVMRRYDIITPQYSFVNVIVNGDDYGIMALEEHFAKELLERNGRKESVIVKFDESLLWVVNTFVQGQPFTVNPFMLYQPATIDAFDSGRVSRSPNLARDFDVASGLLRGFVADLLPASEAFDAELLGSYLAVTEWWGAWHEIRWNNQRFYYNPFTMRLEPIPFDGSLQNRIPMNRGVAGEPIVQKMLDDPKVRAVYERTLDELTQQVVDGDLIDELRAIEQPLLDQLHSEFFMLESFPFAELVARATSTAERHGAGGWIQPEEDFGLVPVYAHAYTVTEDGKTYLELVNVLPLATEVRAIEWRGPEGPAQPFRPDAELDYPFGLEPSPINGRTSSLKIPYDPERNPADRQLVVVFGIEDYDAPHEVREYAARPMVAPLRQNPMPDADLAEQLARNDFLSLDADGTTVKAAPGTWRVTGSIVIPQGYRLRLDAGTTLRFRDDAQLIVFGRADFVGDTDSDVVLEGLPAADGGSGNWQGLLVHSAPQRSTWSHVTIRNTTGVRGETWALTGGTAFYRSDVDMTDTRFAGAHGEDALNIIHGDFKLDDIEISDTASDGFDADFTTGTINGGRFLNIGILGGGDAIDVSGSTVSSTGAMFRGVSDKAISVGEGSRLTARHVTIENVSVGVASKDGSVAEVSDSTIRNASFSAFMAYLKKPEYGPTSLTANAVQVYETKTVAHAQSGNTLIVNGEQVPGKNIDVALLYESVMRPGMER